jgi:group I intron endonuclease
MDYKGFYARETFFIQLFKSISKCLNILSQGKSSIGYKHTEETKSKMKENYTQERKDAVSNLNRGGITDPVHLKNLSESKTAFWNSGSGKSDELKEWYSKEYGTSVQVFNLDGGLYKSYPSFKAAGEDLKACRKYLAKISNTGKIFRGNYIIRSSK